MTVPLEVKIDITRIDEFKDMLTAAVGLLNAMDGVPMPAEVSASAVALRESLGGLVVDE
jgi:hypothetical protein